MSVVILRIEELLYKLTTHHFFLRGVYFTRECFQELNHAKVIDFIY